MSLVLMNTWMRGFVAPRRAFHAVSMSAVTARGASSADNLRVIGVAHATYAAEWNGRQLTFVDDLIATGGTLEAAAKLVRALGGDILGASFIVDLPALGHTRERAVFDHLLLLGEVE